MDKKKTIKYFVITPAILIPVILFVVFFSSLDSQEWDTIEYNGSLYEEYSAWSPVGVTTNEKFAVHLVDYDSNIQKDRTYNANGYTNDPDRVFLFFYGRTYTKKDYQFPDIKNNDVIINKVELVGEEEKFVIENKAVVDEIVNEYRNPFGASEYLKGPVETVFIVQFYIKDYNAYQIVGGIALVQSRHLGFWEDNETIKMFTSAGLEKQLLIQIEKIR